MFYKTVLDCTLPMSTTAAPNRLIEQFRQLGLNTYEAKVYIALLGKHPATGYEVSKSSSVPQARAYDTLKALESKNMVVSMGGKPTTYLPVPPEELLDRIEKTYQSTINELRAELPNYSVESIEPVHNLRGEAAIFNHARQMIENARETIMLEMWSDDQKFLEPALRDANDRGVKIAVVGYNNVSYDFCTVYEHDLADDIEDTLGGRWILLTVDATEGLVGTHPVGQNEPHALWTRNPALVLVIKELVVHDIFLLDIEQTLPDVLTQTYGRGKPRLRNKIFGDINLIGAH